MKKLIYLALTISGISVYAQQPCQPTAQTQLDINNVRATILNGGDTWMDLKSRKSAYEVPKGSGLNSVSYGSLWFSATDGGNQFKLAAQYYRSKGTDYIPGSNVSDCNTYNHIWKVSKAEVLAYLKDTSKATADIRSWPSLAPFKDVDNDGIYSSKKGDYPYFAINEPKKCKGQLMGDQVLWWIFNDNAKHGQTGGASFPLRVEGMAYAYQSTSSAALNNTTFYQYKILNTSSSVLHDLQIGHFYDPNLGNPGDDISGVDLDRNAIYTYNGDNNDESSTTNVGYGSTPPAISLVFLEGPLADSFDGVDNNRNGKIDEENEHVALSSAMFFALDTGAQGLPSTIQQYSNYLKATWKDGIKAVYGGSGYPLSAGSSNQITSFMFSGTTDVANYTRYGAWNGKIGDQWV